MYRKHRKMRSGKIELVLQTPQIYVVSNGFSTNKTQIPKACRDRLYVIHMKLASINDVVN